MPGAAGSAADSEQCRRSPTGGHLCTPLPAGQFLAIFFLRCTVAPPGVHEKGLRRKYALEFAFPKVTVNNFKTAQQKMMLVSKCGISSSRAQRRKPKRLAKAQPSGGGWDGRKQKRLHILLSPLVLSRERISVILFLRCTVAPTRSESKE